MHNTFRVVFYLVFSKTLAQKCLFTANDTVAIDVL